MKRIIVVFLVLILVTGSMNALAEDGGSYINVGDYGSEVIALHQKLADLGYFSLRPESPWSAKSESALKAVQYVLGLDETGIVADKMQYDSIMGLDENLPQFAIKRIQGIDEYLDYIREHEDFTVFIAVQDEASNKLKDSTKEKLRALGLTTDWNQDRYRKAYIAVVEGDHVIEEIAAAEKTGAGLTTSGTMDGTSYRISSSGWENEGGSNCSIVLNDKEWAKNKRGFNFVVVAGERVVDSVAFDTCSEADPVGQR